MLSVTHWVNFASAADHECPNPTTYFPNCEKGLKKWAYFVQQPVKAKYKNSHEFAFEIGPLG
jgi:hypothetical protein